MSPFKAFGVKFHQCLRFNEKHCGHIRFVSSVIIILTIPQLSKLGRKQIINFINLNCTYSFSNKMQKPRNEGCCNI